jgi:hypothetical protein
MEFGLGVATGNNFAEECETNGVEQRGFPAHVFAVDNGYSFVAGELNVLIAFEGTEICKRDAADFQHDFQASA